MEPISSQNPSLQPSQTPSSAPSDEQKKRRRIISIVLIVILILILGVFIRAARNKQGIRGIFNRNTTETANTVSNSTQNTPSNTTNNSTSNQTGGSTNTSNSNNTSGGTGGNSNGGSTSDKSKYPAGKSTISLTYGGVSRSAIIYVPKSYSSSTSTPLVFNLHGSESTAEGQENNSHMDQTAESNGFIVVYPNGINEQWNDGRSYTKSRTGNADDVGFIKELVKTVSEGMNINSRKIYAVGMSNGGMMSHRLACDATSTFAAIGDVAGAMPTDLKSTCSPAGKIPVIVMHGSSDPIVPIAGGSLNSGRGSVLSTLDAVKYWAGINGVSTSPSSTTTINTTSDGTTITHYAYGSQIQFYQVNDGGHTWPGGLQYLRPAVIGLVSKDIDASQVIWDFFKQFSR